MRSSLTLAAVLEERVRIEQIRARRARPGLGAQHLAGARAVAKICGSRLMGGKKGSRELELDPGPPKPGRYSFEIGTAGSTSLIFQTILPVLCAAGADSTAMIYGGTHNPLAPPAEFISESFLPIARAVGMDADLELVLHGFYPKGGGAIRALVRPWRQAGPLDLTAETDWGEPEVTVLIANLPPHVAEREAKEMADRMHLDPAAIIVNVLPGQVGPGNAVMVRYRGADRTAVITSFGEPGKRAERVAQEAAREAKTFARSGAAVDPHLADQLLLPLALGPGGSFTTSAVTEHTRTHALLIRSFLDLEVKIETIRPDRHKLEVPGAKILPRRP